MVVEKLRQLLAQALVLLALVAEQHGALEQLLLQLLRQFAPQIRGGGTEYEKIASGNVIDDLIGMLAHCGELLTVCPSALAQSTVHDAALFRSRGPRAPPSAILSLLPT
jgi:hypothetical protein